ncbi:anti-sigma-K factor rskA [Microterricola gilva]|uniref:Anti-sigma-K factor rskA n=1 Tax=Microterricola gilva TaxID=393267 RepID=A0A4Q8AQ14_9MICO|nr:anti-sigma factor [Microterricola gilva]RZU66203.1 anti-sigma-K factor rskA [Microterricola gilva]
MSERDERLSREASEALHAADQPETGEQTLGDGGNEFSETAAQLGLATTPVQPPASLRDDIMARIALTPQLPAVGEATAGATATADAVTAASPTLRLPAPAPVSEAPGAPVTPEAPEAPAAPAAPAPIVGEEAGPAERRAAARWRRPVGVLLAVAAASALFFGGLAIGTLSDSTPPGTQTQAEQLAAIAAAPDSQRAVAEVAGGGTATLVWSGELGRSALLADGLAPLPADQTYQLWYIGDEGPVSAGTFDASSKGTTWHVLEGEMSAGDTVGVTVEPSGGSDAPTSDPIVAIAS